MPSVTQAYGPNIAFIEELYEKYKANPDSVSASWREFFQDYHPVLEEEQDASGGQAILPVSSGPPILPMACSRT